MPESENTGFYPAGNEGSGCSPEETRERTRNGGNTIDPDFYEKGIRNAEIFCGGRSAAVGSVTKTGISGTSESDSSGMEYPGRTCQ